MGSLHRNVSRTGIDAVDRIHRTNAGGLLRLVTELMIGGLTLWLRGQTENNEKFDDVLEITKTNNQTKGRTRRDYRLPGNGDKKPPLQERTASVEDRIREMVNVLRWGNKQESSVLVIEEEVVVVAPILALPEGSEDFIVYCDASIKEDVFSLKIRRHYLYGNQCTGFTLCSTDHKSLQHILIRRELNIVKEREPPLRTVHHAPESTNRSILSIQVPRNCNQDVKKYIGGPIMKLIFAPMLAMDLVNKGLHTSSQVDNGHHWVIVDDLTSPHLDTLKGNDPWRKLARMSP
ncbi:hypothetical protein Tco_0312965 [Tanacetum coccineum]